MGDHDCSDYPPQSLNSLDCWDYSIELECLQGTQDLQLAAELGKTLLERNKELESSLRQYQNVIDDQTQEIEYLTKQTNALREVNKSRIQIYEKLEVSIQELERDNHRLLLENSDQKKRVKTLTGTVEGLEAKCEELQSTVDDLRLQMEIPRRRVQRDSLVQQTPPLTGIRLRHVEVCPSHDLQSPGSATHRDTVDSSKPESPQKTELNAFQQSTPSQTSPSTRSPQSRAEEELAELEAESNMEQVTNLLTQLRDSRVHLCRSERRIAELEEQLATMVQQNQALENQVMQLHRDEDSKSMYHELSHLDEVRQGQMCNRCLRKMDESISNNTEDDDSSMLEDFANNVEHHSSFSMDVQDHRSNPYKELVEKYEALLKVHCPQQSLSLHEELQMSNDYRNTNVKDTDEESGRGDSLKPEKQHKVRKVVSRTPTDFSEAETSSSGFSEETSNKGTQTEGRPGAFLCTIADGEDCKFSIYDDASSLDSRFRNKPEYQKLFKEIFSVLKKAAESKEEGEELPLLDDHTPVKTTPSVPPVTPSNDNAPDFPDDDTQSIQSSTMSEISFSHNEPTTVIENIIQSQNEPIPEVQSVADTKEQRILRPLVRQPLEYVSVEVRKRNSSRRRNKFGDRSDSPVTHIIGSPKISYTSRPTSGRKKRELRNLAAENEASTWNGNTMQFWSSNRNLASPTPSQGSQGKSRFEYKPSVASQDLHKLKKLDLSYAEVLRSADSKSRHLAKQRRK